MYDALVTSFQKPREGERMIPVEEAQRRVLEEVAPLGSEQVTVTDALGRVLREDIAAPADVPQGDNSAMDGYAVRAEDLTDASAASPAVLRVIENLPAGAVSSRTVGRGMAVRIMTGALLPDGADTVAPVEITDGGGESVSVIRALKRGANVRSRGEDMRAGEIVLRDGTPIHAAEVGVLAGVQRASVCVGRRPTVAILSTGDEIVDIDQQRGAGQVVNSNSYSLSALVTETGAIPRRLGIVRDSLEDTKLAIESALQSDFILSSGGVSAGAYDFVKDALDELGAETKFWQISMKPGKPVVLSRLRERLYFGLPGNPVSCMVSFSLFVAPAIRKAMGQRANLIPPTIMVRLSDSLKSRGDRRNYLRIRVVARDGALIALPMKSQGSGVSTSMVQANALAVLDEGITHAGAGELVPAVMLGPIAAE